MSDPLVPMVPVSVCWSLLSEQTRRAVLVLARLDQRDYALCWEEFAPDRQSMIAGALNAFSPRPLDPPRTRP